MIQWSPCIEPHFSFGFTHNFGSLSALFHEKNQSNMKLDLAICHVNPILSRSNLLDVRLRHRLIVSVLSPFQDRSRLTETPLWQDTKLLPPIRPSFLVTLETIHLGKRMCLKVRGIVRRLGHLRSAKIGDSFHLSFRLLSLYLQIVLEHLLLVHQLLAELLELPRHLRHLFSRHTKQSTRLGSHSRVDHRNLTLQLRYHVDQNMSVNGCSARSCCFEWSNGLWMTVGSISHIQVSNHSQDQCACMSEVLKEFESVQPGQVTHSQ